MGGAGHPHLALLEARGHFGIKRGLDNIRALLEAMGHPERACPVVLLAGTNGKGSTGAFLAHILKASGLSVGWTTSPHLIHPCERLWLGGASSTPEELEGWLGAAFEAERRTGITATYFELMIAAALGAFRDRKVDLALVEVGMGGRWDATNATDPMLTVLTSVGLDHQQYLGETREAIATEKLCTARDGRPLVLGPSLDPHWIGPLLECAPRLCPAPALGEAELHWDHSMVGGKKVGLGGRHQLDNLATALEAVRQLRGLGYSIPEEGMWEAIAATRWPGRLWQVPSLPEVWMDGAHNPDGARALADHALACGLRPHLVVGAMGDKDLAGVARELMRIQPRSVHFVKGEAARYATFPQLREAWALEGSQWDLPQAAAALREAADGPRLVTGSLYLLGDLLRELGVGVY